ncbi:MAG: BLUF domain-containing protein [Planctomycetota bacterium]
MIRRVIYVSKAVRPMGDDDLAMLLEHARTNNEKLGITGMLLYRDGDFLQVLEGPKDAVLMLYSKIIRDQRHHSIATLTNADVPERGFGDWTMAFHQVGAEDLERHDVLRPLADHRLTDVYLAREAPALDILRTFQGEMA